MRRISILTLLLLIALPLHAAKKLRIGVSLHPYFSFAANIAGDKAEIIPLIDDGSNVHGYRIKPDDIKKALSLDVLVINGVGHDEFAMEILKAAGNEKKLRLIYANRDVALIPQAVHSKAVNSHTFVSITASIQQIYTITNALCEIDPANAAIYRTNASAYAAKLRRMKAEYMQKLTTVKNNDFRCATIHGGYSYLLQEFGFQVDDVIEPAHGVEPSAAQLKSMIERIRKAGVKVVFAESDYPGAFVKTIQQETGVRVKGLSHLSRGAFSADYFEKAMRANLDTLLSAVGGK